MKSLKEIKIITLIKASHIGREQILFPKGGALDLEEEVDMFIGSSKEMTCQSGGQ